MLKAKGKIEINDGVRIVTSFDFCKYYVALLQTAHYNTLRVQYPAYGAHITITNPKLHGNKPYNKVLKFKNQIVEFEYDPKDVHFGNKNVWFPVRVIGGIDLEIKNILNVTETANWLGSHLTICNKKFNG